MIKSIFLDIDGTLVSFQTHKIPDSTVAALRQAKANGTKVFISTGRPVAIIDNLGQIADLIDGYITVNGALCMVGETIVDRTAIPNEDVRALADFMLSHDRTCLVVGEREVALLNPKPMFNDVFCEELDVRGVDTSKAAEPLLDGPVLQLSPFISASEEQELMPTMPHSLSSRWHPAFTDITALGADKGNGLKAMAAFLGLDMEETMAFGDGGNDMSILRMAGIGVAMGNAAANVQDAADYVTTTVDNDGIANALKHFGII